jgi:ABC-2 type transport system ATP-binding protein
VIAEGTTGELKAMVGAGSLRVWLVDPTTRPDAERRLARTLQVPVHVDPEPSSLSASVTDPDRAVRALADLSASGITVAGFSLAQPSLDEVFLALTGRRTDELEPVEEAAR